MQADVIVQCSRYIHQWMIYCLAGCSLGPGHIPASVCLHAVSSILIRAPHAIHRTVFPLGILEIRFSKQSNFKWSYITWQLRTAVSGQSDTLQNASSCILKMSTCTCRLMCMCLCNLGCRCGRQCMCNCLPDCPCKAHTPCSWGERIYFKNISSMNIKY